MDSDTSLGLSLPLARAAPAGRPVRSAFARYQRLTIASISTGTSLVQRTSGPNSRVLIPEQPGSSPPLRSAHPKAASSLSLKHARRAPHQDLGSCCLLCLKLFCQTRAWLLDRFPRVSAPKSQLRSLPPPLELKSALPMGTSQLPLLFSSLVFLAP